MLLILLYFVKMYLTDEISGSYAYKYEDGHLLGCCLLPPSRQWPSWWRQQAHLKHKPDYRLHDATTQETTIFTYYTTSEHGHHHLLSWEPCFSGWLTWFHYLLYLWWVYNGGHIFIKTTESCFHSNITTNKHPLSRNYKINYSNSHQPLYVEILKWPLAGPPDSHVEAHRTFLH